MSKFKTRVVGLLTVIFVLSLQAVIFYRNEEEIIRQYEERRRAYNYSDMEISHYKTISMESEIEILSKQKPSLQPIENITKSFNINVTRKVIENTTKNIEKANVTGMSSLTGDWRRKALLFPLTNLTSRYLTIGIPTVKREKDTYLYKTLKSIIDLTDEAQRQEIYIVILLADFDTEWKRSTSKHLQNTYPDLIKSGFLQVIESPHGFYPPLSNLQHTYNDPVKKRVWRSKQNADYAFLFVYSEPLSTYYMQLEDDVYTVQNFYKSIKKTISQMKVPWICLEFSELGFIGKTFHTKHLRRLADMTLMFYEEQPVDFTFLYFNIMMLQFRRHIIRPTLFQHVGIQSSLEGKIQPLKDRYFDFIAKTLKGDNPPAEVYTTILTTPEFPPYMAYSHEDGYFWSHKEPKKGNTFTVVFKTPQSIDRVIIETGSKEHPADHLYHGILEASLTLVNVTDSNAICTNDINLGTFEDGKIDVRNIGSKMGPFKIHCLRITVTADENYWMIIREIAVFLPKS